MLDRSVGYLCIRYPGIVTIWVWVLSRRVFKFDIIMLHLEY